MNTKGYHHIYGPVPSRRLGRSLGIDLVPFKICTYDCIYCQLGRTTEKTVTRKEYVPIEKILTELERKLGEEDTPDYISLAGSGEPTLNKGIGELIFKIKKMTGIPVAVLTNGSLLWMNEVQDALAPADLVLPSLDAGDENLFQQINRPHKEVTFDRLLKGLCVFTKYFSGAAWLEVFLTAGLTGTPSAAEKIAALVRQIGPARIQLNTVCRPPVEKFALALSRQELIALKKIFPGQVEIAGGDEPTDTYSGATPFRVGSGEILELLSRRPCTADDVAKGLGIHITEGLKHLGGLVTAGKIKIVTTGGRNYYTITEKKRTDNHE